MQMQKRNTGPLHLIPNSEELARGNKAKLVLIVPSDDLGSTEIILLHINLQIFQGREMLLMCVCVWRETVAVSESRFFERRSLKEQGCLGQKNRGRSGEFGWSRTRFPHHVEFRSIRNVIV